VSLTCNAWQASNTDGYFAVTGHWIEEPYTGFWELNSALFGFVRLNNAHNGKRLGGALFKIVDRLGIAHKASAHDLICSCCCSHQMRQIGHVTCDNASNNDTMMEFFAIYIEKKTKIPYLHNERRIQYVITDYYIPWDLRKHFLDVLHMS
jgi:hypothetical protein